MPNESAIQKVQSLIKDLDRHGEKKVFEDNPNIPPFRMVSIPIAEGEAIKKWVINEKAASAIEIGMAYGFSALHIGEGLLSTQQENRTHAIVDAFQIQEDKYNKIGLDTLSKAGLDSIIDFHGEKSHLALPKMLREGKQFDFGFIDGCHLFDCVFIDMYYLGLLVKKGGIVFLDDYQSPAIKKAADFFIKNLDWTVEEKGEYEDREWLVLRTSKEQDTRNYLYFVDF